jgi:hypothetical protein
MADITLDELRAKYPPEDRAEYDRAYAAAGLAGQLAELACTLRTRGGPDPDRTGPAHGHHPVLDRPHRKRRQPAHPGHARPPRPRHQQHTAHRRPRHHRH